MCVCIAFETGREKKTNEITERFIILLNVAASWLDVILLRFSVVSVFILHFELLCVHRAVYALKVIIWEIDDGDALMPVHRHTKTHTLGVERARRRRRSGAAYRIVARTHHTAKVDKPYSE